MPDIPPYSMGEIVQVYSLEFPCIPRVSQNPLPSVVLLVYVNSHYCAVLTYKLYTNTNIPSLIPRPNFSWVVLSIPQINWAGHETANCKLNSSRDSYPVTVAHVSSSSVSTFDIYITKLKPKMLTKSRVKCSDLP